MALCDAARQAKILDKGHAADATVDEAEKLKAGIQAKSRAPFHDGHVKVRYRGLEKNTNQLIAALCTVQFVEGPQQLFRSRGMGAPEKTENS